MGNTVSCYTTQPPRVTFVGYESTQFSAGPYAGFDQLPPELLLKIIRLCDQPVKLSVISSSLRRICMSHKQVWTSIDITSCKSVPRVPLHLDRSGDALIDILFCLNGPSKVNPQEDCDPGNNRFCSSRHISASAIDYCTTSILQHAHRLKRLTFRVDVQFCDRRWVEETLSRIKPAMPRLATFKIKGLWQNDILYPGHLLKETQNILHTLSFEGSALHLPTIQVCSSTHSFANLSLTINPHTLGEVKIDIFDILRDHAATLVKVEICIPDGCRSAEHHFTHPPRGDIFMPRLKCLSISRVIAPLNSIDAPDLETFHFRSPNMKDPIRFVKQNPHMLPPCPDAQNALVSFLRKHEGTLQELFLHMHCDHKVYCHPTSPFVTMPLLKVLGIETWTNIGDQLVTIRAPRLQTFLFKPHGSEPCRDVLRHANQYSTSLRMLNVVGSRSSDFLHWEPNVAAESYPFLIGARLQAFNRTTYHHLINQASSRYNGIDSMLEALAPHFKWTAISDQHNNLTLIGSGCARGTVVLKDKILSSHSVSLLDSLSTIIITNIAFSF